MHGDGCDQPISGHSDGRPAIFWTGSVRRTNQCRVEPGGSETRATIYLLPEYATEEEARAYLKEFCSEIFEEQLDGWNCVPSA